MEGLDRSVAGITCREVLADLSAFLDGELTDARVAQLRAHLAGCRECDRFGGAVGAIVAALRRDLARPDALDAAVADRLAERLRAERTR
jgi:anti-sigma factor (TIGR02949 family)